MGEGIFRETLTLRFTGGTASGVELDVGVRLPELDERGIYFVERVSPGLINPLLGWEQGHFIVNSNGAVVAGNSVTVESVELQSRPRSPEISPGVANGISTSTLLNPDSDIPLDMRTPPMSAAEFKQRIRELIQ